MTIEYLKLQNANTVEKSQLHYVDWVTKEEDLSANQKAEQDMAISQVGKIGGNRCLRQSIQWTVIMKTYIALVRMIIKKMLINSSA